MNSLMTFLSECNMSETLFSVRIMPPIDQETATAKLFLAAEVETAQSVETAQARLSSLCGFIKRTKLFSRIIPIIGKNMPELNYQPSSKIYREILLSEPTHEQSYDYIVFLGYEKIEDGIHQLPFCKLDGLNDTSALRIVSQQAFSSLIEQIAKAFKKPEEEIVDFIPKEKLSPEELKIRRNLAIMTALAYSVPEIEQIAEKGVEIGIISQAKKETISSIKRKQMHSFRTVFLKENCTQSCLLEAKAFSTPPKEDIWSIMSKIEFSYK